MSRVNKSVSFSTKDPFEKQLLDYAEEQHDFSKFIKRVLFLHKMSAETNTRPQEVVYQEVTEDDKKLKALKSIDI